MIYRYLLETAGSPGHSGIGTIEQGFRAISTAVCQVAEDSSGLRGIGTTHELRVNSSVYPMKTGDQALLCSDGLHRVVLAEELVKLLDTPLPAQGNAICWWKRQSNGLARIIFR